GVEAMDELAARGVVGFKAFMCSSGIDDFPSVDDLTLYEGMCRAASLGLPVAVHAESEVITAGLAHRARAAGRRAMRDFLASRPREESEALWRALADGTLPMVASDHSPAPWTLKTGEDAFAAWGGISGCQTMLTLLLSEGHHARGLELGLIARATSGYVARRFRLRGKGRL